MKVTCLLTIHHQDSVAAGLEERLCSFRSAVSVCHSRHGPELCDLCHTFWREPKNLCACGKSRQIGFFWLASCKNGQKNPLPGACQLTIHQQDSAAAGLTEEDTVHIDQPGAEAGVVLWALLSPTHLVTAEARGPPPPDQARPRSLVAGWREQRRRR